MRNLIYVYKCTRRKCSRIILFKKKIFLKSLGLMEVLFAFFHLFIYWVSRRNEFHWRWTLFQRYNLLCESLWLVIPYNIRSLSVSSDGKCDVANHWSECDCSRNRTFTIFPRINRFRFDAWQDESSHWRGLVRYDGYSIIVFSWHFEQRAEPVVSAFLVRRTLILLIIIKKLFRSSFC